jgi:DNA-binding NtrC family response regulator
MWNLQPERNRCRLLVVDDEPSIRTLLKHILEMEGFQTTEAGSAREAMRALERHDTDLLVTDIQMPEVSGLQLFEAARAEDPAISILLMSGSAPEQIAANCGCSFLMKPFSFGDLSARVRQLLSIQQRRASAAAPPERA